MLQLKPVNRYFAKSRYDMLNIWQVASAGQRVLYILASFFLFWSALPVILVPEVLLSFLSRRYLIDYASILFEDGFAYIPLVLYVIISSILAYFVISVYTEVRLTEIIYKIKVPRSFVATLNIIALQVGIFGAIIFFWITLIFVHIFLSLTLGKFISAFPGVRTGIFWSAWFILCLLFIISFLSF